MRLWSSVLVLALGTAPAPVVDGGKSAEVTLQRCLAAADEHRSRSGSAVAGWTDCYDAAGRTADSRLNRAYRRLMARNVGNRTELVSAEQKWLLFRDAWCSAESAMELPVPQIAGCKYELTQAHTRQILELAGAKDQ